MRAMGKKSIFLLGVVVVLLSCNLPSKTTPTSLPPEVIATSVALTANALIASSTAPAPPTATPPAPSETPTPTKTPTPTVTAEPTTPVPQKPFLVANTNLNVRTGPGTVYPKIGELPKGATAVITGKDPSGTWWQIEFPPGSGKHGWVSAAYVSASNEEDVPVAAVPPTPLPPFQYVFWADNTSILQGACTNLHWDVEGAQTVYLDGAEVTRHNTKQVCPGTTQTYTLHMVKPNNSTEDGQITIKVMPKINVLPTPGFFIPLQPDLVVESASHSANPKCNQVYTVYFTIKNDGTVASGSFKVQVFFVSSPNPIKEFNISNLEAGASQNASFIGSAGCQSPVTMRYNVVLDPEDNVTEFNEDNNVKEIDVPVTP